MTYIYQDYHLHTDIKLDSTYRLKFIDDVVFNGNGHRITFGAAPAILMDSNITVTLTNVILDGLSPEMIEQGADSKLIFGDGTRIILDRDGVLSRPWFFDGDTSVEGGNHRLTMVADGAIKNQGGLLTTKSTMLRNVTNGGIKCLSDNADIILDDCLITLDDELVHDQGMVYIIGETKINGEGGLVIEGQGYFTVASDTEFIIDRGVIFEYAADSPGQLVFEDGSSVLRLNSSTFKIGSVGARLLSGTLHVDGASVLDLIDWQGRHALVEIGNGVEVNNFIIRIAEHGELTQRGGTIVDRNSDS